MLRLGKISGGAFSVLLVVGQVYGMVSIKDDKKFEKNIKKG